MLQVLSIIWTIIKNIPQFLVVVREIMKFFKEEQDKAAQKEMREKIKEATENAKQKKDTAKLDQLWGNRGSNSDGNNNSTPADSNSGMSNSTNS